ncbi:hypothetical protein [Haloferax sp. DFSO52]|uniref:hypothetical protein n=1 Tax=Haloferax sp. DFSO52 TaxID=3388505 RepID=UPI003A862DD9
MAINRRNVLLGLGAIVGGGGALVGTGAFSNVSAARSVSVSTAGDASALLTLTGSEYTTTNADDTVNLDLDANAGFNKNAITKLSDVLTITNNEPDTNSSADVGIATGDLSGGAVTSSSGELTLLFTNADGSVNHAVVSLYLGPASTDSIANGGSVQTLASGESAYLDIEIDTRDSTLSGSPSADATINGDTGNLVIVATQ